MASANWEKTSTQALGSEVQLLAWAMATPSGAPVAMAHAQHVLAGQAPVVVSSTPWAARRPFAGAAWAAPINGVRRRRR